MKRTKTSPPAQDAREWAELEQAYEQTAAILERDPARDISDPTLPVYQLLAREFLVEHEEQFAAGNRASLLSAIRVCANHDVPMPLWLARAFIAAYDKVLKAEVGSWDAAFRRPYPPGTHLSAVRKRQLNRFRVRGAVDAAHRAGAPIGTDLFEKIGRQLGLGRTLVSELYYGKPKARGGNRKPNPK